MGSQIVKYTEMSETTGIYETNQYISTQWGSEAWLKPFFENGLVAIADKSNEFVVKRNWKSHDTKTNLGLALCSETGELADVLAWTGDTLARELVTTKRDKLAQEMADIVIVVVRLAAVCGIELSAIMKAYQEEPKRENNTSA